MNHLSGMPEDISPPVPASTFWGTYCPSWTGGGFAQKLSIRRASRPPESGGQRDPIGSRERRFLSEPFKDAALEPPLARSRLRLDRAALLTEEGEPPFGNDFLCKAP